MIIYQFSVDRQFFLLLFSVRNISVVNCSGQESLPKSEVESTEKMTKIGLSGYSFHLT